MQQHTRWFQPLAFGLVLASVAISASGHPGKTDATGCHTDNRTNDYHCDHGTDATPASHPSASAQVASPRPPTASPSASANQASTAASPHIHVPGAPVIVTRGVVATASSDIPEQPPFQGDVIEGVVVRVVDGDTLKVYATDKKTYVVRLRGIDAPKKGQPFAKEAMAALARIALKKPVTAQWNRRDSQGRWVGRVFTADADLSYEQIRSGAAWWFAKAGSEHEQEFSERRWDRDAEAVAQATHLGLWAGTSPIPPWEWQKAKK